MAGDTFEKLKMSVNRGITTISVKTSASMERSRVLTNIDTLEKENKKDYAVIGEEAYALWESGIEDFSKLYEKFEVIKKRKADIEGLNEQLVLIEEKNKEILGRMDETPAETAPEVTEQQPPVNTEKFFCSNCGEAYEMQVKFCRKCGNKM